MTYVQRVVGWLAAIALLLGLGFALGGIRGLGLGLTFGAGALLLDAWGRATSTRAILGAVAGLAATLGLTRLTVAIVASLDLTGLANVGWALPVGTAPLLVITALSALGLSLGAFHARWPLASASPAAAPADAPGPRSAAKILDTSVIIDGRVADIINSGFLDGPLVIPQFVLRELQTVADSADPIRRNRGRRGLNILKGLRQRKDSGVVFSDLDYPEVQQVDLKLIELARELGGKIVTNDFNLNKVAGIRGIPVLNINELANAVKPAVLVGEGMRVFVLKEGKEAGQGVAYLDDGTMVVVEQASRLLSRTVDIVVTSVHQTPAGKMIFGRLGERDEREESDGAAERRDRARRRPSERARSASEAEDEETT